MAQNLRGTSVSQTKTTQHSVQLRNTLNAVAKSLSSRPQELRGPFVVRSGQAQQTSKK